MRVERIRFEYFGGIIATTSPTGLVWVDREYLRLRGYDGGRVWQGDDPGYLSGPVEAEIAVTERCNLHCPCCYTNSSATGAHLPWEAASAMLDKLAELGVFHLAFGGGEPLLYPDLLPLARKARSLGLIPSLTTNGTLVTAAWAQEAAQVFARVNVSVAAEEDIRQRAVDPWQAVQLLSEAGIICGINLIIHPGNLSHVEAMCRRAKQAGADSALFLRPKPSGRGSTVYTQTLLTDEQQTSLLRELLAISRKTGLRFHLDCAWAPLLLAGGPSRKRLEQWGASGCIAGDLLLTIDIEGRLHPCSHLSISLGHVSDLPKLWHESEILHAFRRRKISLDGRCGACQWLDLCGGGCAVVNEFYGLPLAVGESDICK